MGWEVWSRKGRTNCRGLILLGAVERRGALVVGILDVIFWLFGLSRFLVDFRRARGFLVSLWTRGFGDGGICARIWEWRRVVVQEGEELKLRLSV